MPHCIYDGIDVQKTATLFNCSLCKSIQIIHSSEGIGKNYPHKVPLEQSNTSKAIAEGVWTVSKVPSVGNFYKMMFYNMIC